MLHITSLPGGYGIGDLGPSAYEFADFLADAKQSFWQVLPLNSLAPGGGGSPYSAISAFAGNTLLISPDALRKQGLLKKEDINPPHFSKKVDFDAVAAFKKCLFEKAFSDFIQDHKKAHSAFEIFCSENKSWLDDYAVFCALREHFDGRPWYEWPKRYRDRQKNYLRSMDFQFRRAVEREKFLQYIFFTQWFALKQYCNQRGISIIGDIPLYVGHDSADVWVHRETFELTSSGKPTVVAGVPPDAFSKTGQRWGNPIYDWQRLKKNRYSWWMARMRHNLETCDIVRIDHFIGLVSYYEIPARRQDATKGKWRKGPGDHFFGTLFEQIPFAPIIVEDLGPATAGVKETMRRFGLPGMNILQYAFRGDFAKTPHIPHNHLKNSVTYPGTHDHNTIKGWFEKEMSPQQKRNLFAYLGHKVGADNISWGLIRLAMSSVSDLVVISMQDVLALGADARMNTPATTKGNWKWRMQTRCSVKTCRNLAALTDIFGRA